MSTTRAAIGLMLAATILAAAVPVRAADEGAPGADVDRTPPRLSFTDGAVSFWRPGAQDWAPAQVNTPLAPGDELYTGSPGNLEVQIGPGAFVRAWGDTQLGLGNQDPGYVQVKVTAGHASLDLRSLEPGRAVEVGTPSAAFTIDRPGYYRLDVDGDRTDFVVRGAGQAAVALASGPGPVVAAGQQVVIEGGANPRVATGPAPAPDSWDQWNDVRTAHLVSSPSARYVGAGVYGASDLDRYGTWRSVPTYGAVWFPRAVPTGWAPYSTGTWMLDPSYGWTWVDTAPWGWAPYHYGRWVFVNGYWAWAPGPVPVRPVYAPALVAFYGGPPRAGVVAGPVGWVPLGWGEPCVPWWGRPGFAHVAWWGGWAGPRVVNNVVISKTTVVNVQNITVYKNASVQNAVTVVDREGFGRGPIAPVRNAKIDMREMRPTHAAPEVAAVPASYVPTTGRGPRPPEKDLERSVVGAPASSRPMSRPMPPTAATAPSPAEPKLGRGPVHTAPPSARPAAPGPQVGAPAPQVGTGAPPAGAPGQQVVTPPRPQGQGQGRPPKTTVEVPRPERSKVDEQGRRPPMPGPSAPPQRGEVVRPLPAPSSQPSFPTGQVPQRGDVSRQPIPGQMGPAPSVNRPQPSPAPRPEPTMTRPEGQNEPQRGRPGGPSGRGPSPAEVKQLQRVGHPSPHRDGGDAQEMRKKDRHNG